ncbi:MAG: anthranilate synthase component I family protein [Deltaproteobacteria bacterium]
MGRIAALLRRFRNLLMVSVELKKELPARVLFRAIQQEKGVVWIDRATGGGPSFMAFSPASQLMIARESTGGLDAIAEFVRRATPDDAGSVVPHTFGFLGYDLATTAEPRMELRHDAAACLPRAHLAHYDIVFRCDPRSAAPDAPCRITAWGHASRKLAAVVATVEARLDAWVTKPEEDDREGRLVQWPPEAPYCAAVKRALEYIAAGDIYQLNLAGRLVGETEQSHATTYLRLRQAQPVPFGVYFDAGDFKLLSNSPERFLRVHGDAITTEPIKGTRRRDADTDRDHGLAQELRMDPKERAENVMIVDLERNDLGRICARGSVHVPSLLRVESWSTLHHLVSTVSGRLRPDTTLDAILRATFPGGSITGAPKIRASQIIAELEDQAREIYTGSFFAFTGPRDFDSSILIRTAIARGTRLSYHAGCGIVADSDPGREYAELWLKARPFLSALGIPPTQPISMHEENA